MKSMLKKQSFLLVMVTLVLSMLTGTAAANPDTRPALAISEVYANTKGYDCTEYLELINLSAAPLDLYNYKLMGASGEAVDQPTERQVMLTDKQGQYVLAPGECAIVWFVFADSYKEYVTTLNDFISLTKEEQGIRAEGLEKRMIIPVDITITPDHVSDKAKFHLVNKEVNQILICPRDGIWSDAICSLTYNDDPSINDAISQQASIWKLGEPGSKKMVRINNATDPTPGYLAEGQTF
jgi:hypothetical protein